MVVSNHLSYLDVLLFSAAAPCVFISKSDVKSWPIFGALAKAGGTIFVNRRRVQDTVDVNRQIEESLACRVPIVLFPEATSSDGSSVLPFRSSLFEPAIRSGAAITPAYVSYRTAHGLVAPDVCYWGDVNFVSHLLKLLGKDGIKATICFGQPLQHSRHRKTAAKASHEAVVRLSSTAL